MCCGTEVVDFRTAEAVGISSPLIKFKWGRNLTDGETRQFPEGPSVGNDTMKIEMDSIAAVAALTVAMAAPAFAQPAPRPASAGPLLRRVSRRVAHPAI
jgi:hypothetical protein